MKQYNFFQALFLAFFSKSLYRDVGQNWPGRGFLYTLFLAFCFSIASFFYFYHAAALGMQEFEPVVTQFPTVTIQKGEATIDKPVPYQVTNPKTNKVVGIFDTSSQVKNLENTDAIFLMTKNQLHVKEDKTTVKTYDLSNIRDGVYGPDSMQKVLHFLGYISLAILYSGTLAFIFIRGIAAIFIFAGIAKIFTHTTLNFKTLCRLAAVAMTPAVILAFLVELSFLHIPYIWIAYIAISLGYFLFAIEANEDSTDKAVV